MQTEIAAQLAIFDAKADDRTGGERMAATKVRNEALALFTTMLSRVRHYLCSASDDVDQSPELRHCGFKVRRDRTKPAKPAAQGGGAANPVS